MRSLAEIVSLRTPACHPVAAVLPAIAAGEESGSRSAGGVVPAQHVAQCLRCQAELSAYRRLLDELRALRDDNVPVPEGALAELLRALAEQKPSTWALRAAYVGGITVTAAAGAAGVLVWMSRRRLAPAS
jgi:hypothetical protein